MKRLLTLLALVAAAACADVTLPNTRLGGRFEERIREAERRVHALEARRSRARNTRAAAPSMASRPDAPRRKNHAGRPKPAASPQVARAAPARPAPAVPPVTAPATENEKDRHIAALPAPQAQERPAPPVEPDEPRPEPRPEPPPARAAPDEKEIGPEPERPSPPPPGRRPVVSFRFMPRPVRDQGRPDTGDMLVIPPPADDELPPLTFVWSGGRCREREPFVIRGCPPGVIRVAAVPPGARSWLEVRVPVRAGSVTAVRFGSNR